STILLRKYLGQEISAINKKTSQETLYAITNGVMNLTLGVIGNSVTLIADLSLLIVLFIGIFVVNPFLALSTVLIFSSIALMLFKVLHKKAKSLGESQSIVTIESNEKIIEILQGFREIFVRNKRSFYAESISSLRFRLSKDLAESAFLPYIGKYVLETAVILAALLISAIQFVMSDAPNAIATMSIFLASATRIAPAVLRMQQSGLQIQSAVGAALPTLNMIEEMNNLKKPISISAREPEMFVYPGFEGTVIRISNNSVQAEVDACSGAVLTIGAGEDWDEFVATTIDRGFAGLETLSGIPGTVGAAPIQNIGAYGHEVSEFITRVRTYDREKKEIRTFTNSECEFSYRSSHFKSHPGRYVVLEVQFQIRRGEMSDPITYAELSKKLGINMGDKASVVDVRKAVLELRGAKGMLINSQDKDSWSAGSFFTNPIISQQAADGLPNAAPKWPLTDGRVKISAAWLIENSGIHKGDEVGGARISTKHVLALTNAGNATAADIATLARKARDQVQNTFGITLEAEVNLVGIEI
ncbi:MAG: UDP-N-acetylmuramate dehydrogenase, partial [Actinobacteria bacterium]|nr:UDP-N-acetylmuramate dehydrogenase [Actinomycetota bacterium]